nr:response regulator [Frankia sp. Mgl5]
MTSVLVVDDDLPLLRALRVTLDARGYQVITATDGAQALAAAAGGEPDIIVLDLGLPDLDGIDVIHALRGWTATPVVVLSGRAGSVDKIAALDAGADDYVTKPFRTGEFLARLRAVARRTPVPAESLTVAFGHYLIDLGARRVTRNPMFAPLDGVGDPRLTPTEWHLLDILLQSPEKLLTHRQLLPQVGGPSPKEQSHYLRQYMGRLRRKLELDPARPRHLITEPGMGYRFQPMTRRSERAARMIRPPAHIRSSKCRPWPRSVGGVGALV